MGGDFASMMNRQGRDNGFIFATVGNLKSFKYVDFSYRKKTSHLKLATFAVGKSEGLTPILFVPHSLSEEEINDVRDIAKGQGADIVISPSFGSYNCNYEVSWPLTFFYFFHFLRIYRFRKISKFFVDISVGLNQLTFAMLEAFRFLRVFSELSNLGEREKPKFYIAYSEPVARREIDNSVYRVYSEDFKTKVFPSMPVSWKDEKRIVRSIKNLPIKESTKQDFEYVVEKALYATTSVINNIPLAIYLLGYDRPKHIRDFIIGLLKELEPIMGNADTPPEFKNENGKIKYSFMRGGVEYRLVCNVILLLGLYLGISKTLSKLNVPYIELKGVKVDELYEKFSKIYDCIFGENSKNKIILEKDIYRLKGNLKKFSKYRNIHEEWYSGEEFDKDNGNRPTDKRNFIAHSGLLSSLIEANYESGIRYKREVKEKVKKLLREI